VSNSGSDRIRPEIVLLDDDPLETLVSTSEAAQIAGVSAATVRKWKQRGLIAPAGLDERNRPLYRMRDVALTERKTRQRNWGKLL